LIVNKGFFVLKKKKKKNLEKVAKKKKTHHGSTWSQRFSKQNTAKKELRALAHLEKKKKKTSRTRVTTFSAFFENSLDNIPFGVQESEGTSVIIILSEHNYRKYAQVLVSQSHKSSQPLVSLFG